MLVCSNKRLVPVQINTTILQGDDGTYYYLHRDLYDQLTILADSFDYGEHINLITKILTEVDQPLPENLQRFYDTVPMPIKMAAPFLMLIKGYEKLDSIEEMCGALTVISMSANLRRILKVPKELRAPVTFSLHITEEYKTAWDRFFQENPEFGTAVTLPTPGPVNNFIPTPEGTTVVQNTQTGEEVEINYTSKEEDVDYDALLADLMSTAQEQSGKAADETPASPASDGPAIPSGFAALDNL